MARIHYVGKDGAGPPLSELEREKLEGQRLANEISQTKLRRLREETLERRQVKFIFENTLTVLQREMRRWPALVVRMPQFLRFGLSHEQLHGIRMSLDQFIRGELDKVSDALEKALASPRAVIAEIVDEPQPSEKDLEAAARKKDQANAKRRERRKVKP